MDIKNVNKEDRILRFHPADKIFHGVNAITWFILFFTGMIAYATGASDECKASMMYWHIVVGVIFTINIIAYLVMAPERFAVTLKNLMEWDMNTIRWFYNLGGYPRRFFKINFGPEEVPPQGRYNGGQKASYLLFFFFIFGLAVTGWLLFACAPLIGKGAFVTMFYFHVWGSALITLLVVCAHIPLAIMSWSHFTGIWAPRAGYITVEAAEHHAPTWFARDVIRINNGDANA